MDQNNNGGGSKTPQAEDSKLVEDMTVPENLMEIEEVQNWDDRMNRANYNEMQRNAVGQCLRKIDEWLNFTANGSWEEHDTNKKEGYTIYTATSPNGYVSLKTVGTFEYSAMQMFAVLHDKRYR